MSLNNAGLACTNFEKLNLRHRHLKLQQIMKNLLRCTNPVKIIQLTKFGEKLEVRCKNSREIIEIPGELINFPENLTDCNKFHIQLTAKACETTAGRRPQKLFSFKMIKTLSVFGFSLRRRLNNNKIKTLPDNLLASMSNLVRV